MSRLKYKIITSEKQYEKYCAVLEELVFLSEKNADIRDEIDLITLLIEKWDDDHFPFKKSDPVSVLRSLMSDHELKAVDIARLLKVSEGLVSDILHYKKGLSKENIRLLSAHFKVKQEIFNRPYELKLPKKRKRKK